MCKNYILKRALAVCIAFTLTLCTFGISKKSEMIKSWAVETDKYDQQLSDLELQQAQLDKKIKDAQDKLDKENDNLEAINDKVKALKAKIKNIEEQSAQLENQMVEIDTEYLDTQAKLEEQNKEIEESKSDFMERIRAMYIAGGHETYTNVLLSSGDFYDILMRAELVKRVAQHDNGELEKLMEKKREIEKTQSLLETQTNELSEKANEYSKKQTELAKQQLELLKTKEESTSEISKLEGDVSDLNAQSQAVSQEHSKVSSNFDQSTTTTKAGKTTKKTTTKKTTTAQDDVTDAGTTTTKKTQTTTVVTEDEPKKTTTTTKNVEEPITTTTTTQQEDVYDPDLSKAEIVCNYAKSNVGGAYVWGGASFKACDCSGLVMMSYAKVGMSLPHLASSQASYGTAVSYDNMQAGDLIFFGGSSYSSIYHVAIYTGGGNMVHAANSSQGIIISSVASFSKYNNITVIKRLL